MKTGRSIAMVGLLILVAISASACSFDIARNDDGSLTVEGAIDEATLQSEIEWALNDPLIQNLTVDLQGGQIFVTAERQQVGGGQVNTLTFQLALGASDGHLTATITDAQLDGTPIDEARVAVWNERIASKLSRAGGRNPNSTLESVTLTSNEVVMTWHVETRHSRGD